MNTKFFSTLKKKWNFDRKICHLETKNYSNIIPLRQVPLADYFVIPIKQHIGMAGELCIKLGDNVLRGQPLTLKGKNMLPVHAPTSGKIVDINLYRIARHHTMMTENCVVIQADGEDKWIEYECWNNYYSHSYEELIERIHQFGIAGLGGIGFPSAIKLRKGMNKITKLIINAAECEPYITADDRLIQECAEQIIDGIHILMYILQPREVLIGIEENKQEAISALRTVLKKDSHGIALHVIPTKYPSGDERQLIQILIGQRISYNTYLHDIGILVQNVGTVYAIKRAIINGEPLTERVVTLTGKSVLRPGNIWARLGTPVSYLLKHAGFCPGNDQTVIIGGPFMGFALKWLEVPVIKTTNCLLAPSAYELGKFQKERECIRCSICVDVCPAGLFPQQLYWFSKNFQHAKTLEQNIFDCIECGACAWVCPSNIPLVQYFRQEKEKIHIVIVQENRASQEKARFQARFNRIKKKNTKTISNASILSDQKTDNDKVVLVQEICRSRKNCSKIEKIKKILPKNKVDIPYQKKEINLYKIAVKNAVMRVQARKEIENKNKIS